MSPKNFLILAGATAASVALAAVAVVGRDVPLTSRPAAAALAPGLLDRANEVRAVKITGPGTATLTLAAGDQGWTVAEKGGYPAKPTKAREVVLQLGNLQLVEAKTAQPDRLKRLELEDPGKEGAKSRLVELVGADGKPVAAAVVGKTRYGLYGGGRSGVYVRRPGEPQSWLAAGTLELPSDALDLVDVQVVDVPLADVAKVTLGVGSGQEVSLSKPDAAAAEFTLAGAVVPEGKELDKSKVEEVAGMLGTLSMQDVKPAKDLAVPPDARRSRVETFDGLVVDTTLVKTGEGEAAEHWVLLDAGAKEGAAPPAPAAAAAPMPPGEGTEAAPAKPSATERAAELDRRFAGWAFKVAPYQGEHLGATLDYLLADKPPAS
jgi:hypothetical protein